MIQKPLVHFKLLLVHDLLSVKICIIKHYEENNLSVLVSFSMVSGGAERDFVSAVIVISIHHLCLRLKRSC